MQPIRLLTERIARSQISSHSSTGTRKVHTGSTSGVMNYTGHTPLSASQNALLALGSGIVGVMDTSRGGEHVSWQALRVLSPDQ